MAKLKTNILAVKFDKNEIRAAERKLMGLLFKATQEVSLDVAKRVYKDINMSGNVPFDTGQLKADTNVFHDHFDRNFATMGWFQPYARKMYFGIHGFNVWKTINGKRTKFRVNETGNGIPFWDIPFTRNTTYMIRMYEWAFRKQKLLR